MSRSMSAPWLQATMAQMIAPPSQQQQQRSTAASQQQQQAAAAALLKPRVVQVVRGNDEARILEVSDKESTIVVMLTEKCCAAFTRMHSNMRLASLRNFIVKLDEWHVSTVMQAAGDREMAKICDLKISFPLALQCRRLTLLGASDVTLAGEPLDVNRSRGVRVALAGTSYLTLTERLRERQFPSEVALPDSSGIFSVPPPIGEAHPLRPSHCAVGRAEREALARQAAMLNVPIFRSSSEASTMQSGNGLGAPRGEAVRNRRQQVQQQEEDDDDDAYSLLSSPDGDASAPAPPPPGSAVASRLRSRVVVAPSYPVALRRPAALQKGRAEVAAASAPSSSQDQGPRDVSLAAALSSHTLASSASSSSSSSSPLGEPASSSWFTQPLNDALISEMEGWLASQASQPSPPRHIDRTTNSTAAAKTLSSSLVQQRHSSSSSRGASGPVGGEASVPVQVPQQTRTGLLGQAVRRSDGVRGVVVRRRAVGDRSRLIVKFDDGRVESLDINTVLSMITSTEGPSGSSTGGDASSTRDVQLEGAAEVEGGEEMGSDGANAFSRSLQRLLQRNRPAEPTVAADTATAPEQQQQQPSVPEKRKRGRPRSAAKSSEEQIAVSMPAAVVESRPAAETAPRKRGRGSGSAPQQEAVPAPAMPDVVLAPPVSRRPSAFSKALGLLMVPGGATSASPGQRRSFATSYFE